MLQQLHSVIIGTWSNGSRNSPTTAKTFLRLLSDVGMYLNEKWKLCVSKSAFFPGDALWVASCSVCFPAFPAPFMTDLLVLLSLCPEVSQHVFSRTWDILLPNHSKVTEIRKFNIDTESFIFICKCVSYHAPPICPGSKPEFHGVYYFLIRNTKQLFKKLFFMWTIFKTSLLDLLQNCFHLMFCLFWPQGL